jgi:DNA excision repair protein ERCC-1
VQKPKVFRHENEQQPKAPTVAAVPEKSVSQSSAVFKPLPSTSGGVTATTVSQPNAGLPKNPLKSTGTASQPVTSRRATILVNSKQKGNPLLRSIELNNVQFSEILPDYVMGRVCCALFLSLKYHNVYPNYVYERINSLGKQYQLRVMVVLVDIPNANQPLKELMQVCLLSDFVLMCAWTFEEAGKIIDTYKVFENRSAESLMDKQAINKSSDYQGLLDSISSIKSINKTDAISLVSTFESLERLIKASTDQLAVVPGLGPTKAKVIHEFFRRKTKR